MAMRKDLDAFRGNGIVYTFTLTKDGVQLPDLRISGTKVWFTATRGEVAIRKGYGPGLGEPTGITIPSPDFGNAAEVELVADDTEDFTGTEVLEYDLTVQEPGGEPVTFFVGVLRVKYVAAAA